MKAAEDSKDYQKAITIATEAINGLAPASFFYSFRARMYYAIKEQELAEKDIEYAANLNPLDEDVVKYYEGIKRRTALKEIEKAQQSNLEARKKQFDALIANSKKAMCWSCMGKGTKQVVTSYTTKTSSEDVWTAQQKTVNTSTGSVRTDYGFSKQSVTTQVPNYKTVPCDKCDGKGTDGITISKQIRRQYADVIKAYYPYY
jgi:tetratricopeptide (TPR) repeat protein